MGFFKWLSNGVGAVGNFFDSLYMRLPSTVRGLLWGLGMVCTFFWVVLMSDKLFNLYNKLFDWLFGLGK
jgi:hypothetical protein